MIGVKSGVPAQRPAPSRMTDAVVAGSALRPQVRSMVRNGLVVYFLMVILEGAFRKWLMPELNQYIYIAKDAVLVLICLRVVLSLGYIPSPTALRRTTVGQLILVFAVYSFCQGFNLRLPNIVLGIWGIRTYVLPISLVYLIPLGMPDPRVNERLFRRYLLIGIPMALLCFAQYRLPPGHIVNKYANTELGKNVALVVDAVRVSGTFSYISGMGNYIAFQAAGLLGVLFASGWKFQRNKLMWFNLVLTVAVIPMTGSRAIALYFLLYLMIVAMLGQLVRSRRVSQSRLVIAGICVAAFSVSFFGDAFDRLGERTAAAYDTGSRFEKLVIQPMWFLDKAGLFGFGAAATHQAAGVLVPGGYSYFWLPTRDFEDEAGRVMLELGGVGFILYIALKVAVCFATFQYIRKFGNAVPLAIPVACLLTTTGYLATGMLFSSVGSSFYWGIFGLFVAQATATRTVRPGA